MGTKEIYEDKLQAQLDVWRAELDKLKAQARVAETGLQLKMNEQAVALGDRVDKAQVKLDELKAQTEDASGDLMAGVERSWLDLTDAFKNASNRFK